MVSIWFLYTAGLAVLVRGDVSGDQCQNYQVMTKEDSPLIASLKCHNNYKTYGECTWEVDQNLHQQTNFSLNPLTYYDITKNTETDCIPQRHWRLPNGNISYTCRYSTKRFTSVNMKHIVYFKVPCASTTLRVGENGKVRAPVNFSETVADGGARLLSWSSPYPASSNITRTLVYQLQYRRHMDDWTTVDNINVTEHTIDMETLLPGYQYEARVRARGPVGLWSDWSPLVSWKTHSDGLLNLECLIVGDTTVNCTWQMETAYVHLKSYQIWCNDNSNAAYACCETPQLQPIGVGRSEFVCSVNTTDPYMLTVELRPVKYIQEFNPKDHIKFPTPQQIQVVEDDGRLELNWSVPEFNRKLKCNTEIKVSSGEASKTYTHTEDNKNYPILNPRPSTDYRVQIRLVQRPADTSFTVQSSEWSEEVVYTTKPGNSSSVADSLKNVAYLAVPVVAVMIAIIYKSLPACRRSLTTWKGSIPSPIKSKVLEGMIKKHPTGWLYSESEKETTSPCVLLAIDNFHISKSGDPLDQALIKTEDANKKPQSGGSDHSHEYVEEHTCKDQSGMSFSGPYILCSEDSCTHDKATDGSPDQDQTNTFAIPETFTPVHGGYVATPRTAMPATENPTPTATNSPTNNPSAQPPEYTHSPDLGCTVIPHPSGYFTMPCVAAEPLQPRGYVTLAHNET